MKKTHLLFLFMLISIVSYTQQNWYQQTSGTNLFLFDVHFANSQEGWIAGTSGIILHTYDGGINWFEQDAPPSNAYFSIHFNDNQNGWATGYSGAIIRTEDGGEIWETKTSGVNTFLYDVHFIDQYRGWIVGGDQGSYPSFIPHRVVLKTLDGGNTWFPQLYNSDEYPLMSVRFINEDIGFAAGERGTILKTINGGQDWFEKMSDPFYEFYSVFFINESKGWAVGQYLGLPHVSVIFNTSNGGDNWDMQIFGQDEILSDVFFIDELKGWTVGGSATTAVTLYTEDGGSTWFPENAGTTNSLYSVYFTDEINGWAVGYNGTIISTYVMTGLEDPEPSFSTSVFPNPSSGQITLSVNTKLSKDVTIRIFHSSGQLVWESYENVNSEKDININLSHLENGVYLVLLESADQRIQRKFLKID